MNTPNKLTVARMILVPFLVLFMLTDLGGEANRYIALAIFVVASVTDWFDGKLARKYNLVTNFGKFMDPLADKLMANYWGKFKTVSQMIMIILLLIDLGGVFDILEQIFIWLSLALTVISLITYIWQNRSVLSMQD